MTDMKKTIVAMTVAVCGFYAAPAQAQMANDPWTFTPQNRAGIASLIRSAEEGNDSGAAGSVSGSGSIVNLVCGGNSDGSTAQANNTCIILNNSEGADVDVDQDSEGDQTATSEENLDVDETIVSSEGNVDDVLDTLNGTN